MAGLEELLEGLADEGVRSGVGTFTMAPNQVWQGLHRSIGDPSHLPRFIVRWLAHQSGQAGSLGLQQQGRKIRFKALDLRHQGESDAPCPTLDYAGEDIDLARGIICAQLLKAEEVRVTIASPGRAWVGEFVGNSPAVWSLEEWTEPGMVGVDFNLPRKNSKQILLNWKSLLKEHFHLSPLPLSWNEEPLSAHYRFSTTPLVWRRLLPLDKHRPLLPFQPLDSASSESFVCPRYPESEILMSLGTGTESDVRIVHRGDLLPFSRPGFLPGFEIVAHLPRLALDIQGTSVVKNDDFGALLDQLKEEAYDMVLQIYRLDEQPDSATLVAHLVAFEGVLLYLLDQQRWVEGYHLALWLDRAMGECRTLRTVRENYTFLKTASMLAEKANQPKTAQLFQNKAKVLTQDSRSLEVEVEIALIDAYLDSKTRSGEQDRLNHHTRSRLHLLAVRCKNNGQDPHALRLFRALLTNYAQLGSEQLDLWFETAEIAKKLGRFKTLKSMLLMLKRSQEAGTLVINSFTRSKANTYADAVKASQK